MRFDINLICEVFCVSIQITRIIEFLLKSGLLNFRELSVKSR